MQPDAAQENDFLDSHTWDDYSAWHLGLTDEVPDETRGRYAFVYGDFRRVHRTGLIPARYRAAQWRHEQVELAAHDLLQHLDEVSARSLVSPGPPPGRRATRDLGEAGMPESMKAFVTKGIGVVGIMEKPISEPRSTRLCRGGSERMSRLIERGCVDPTTRRPIATSTRSSGPSR